MRDPNRIPEILETIKEIWMRSPDLTDLRLMQLLINCQVGYYTEDEELLERLKETYKDK